MKKLLYTLLLFFIGTSVVWSQENIMEKLNLNAAESVNRLGDPIKWSRNNGDEIQYFEFVNNFANLFNPQNQNSLYLFPEGYQDNAQNFELGTQAIYIDFGEKVNIGTIQTTWERGGAKSFDIFILDEIPDIDVLNSTPTYTEKDIVDPGSNPITVVSDLQGKEGQYLVLHALEPITPAYGIKLWSIIAFTPMEKETLSQFSISPRLFLQNIPTEVELTLQNQVGQDIDISNVNITTSDNITFQNGMITFLSGNQGEIKAEYDGSYITNTLYVPSTPPASQIKENDIPIYSNSIIDKNSNFSYELNWNGGARDGGEFNFDNNIVAHLFKTVKSICVGNQETTNGVQMDIKPNEKNLKTLHFDILTSNETTITVNFESYPETKQLTVNPNEWYQYDIEIADIPLIHVIKLDVAPIADILLANIYFTTEVEEEIIVGAPHPSIEKDTNYAIAIYGNHFEKIDPLNIKTSGTNKPVISYVKAIPYTQNSKVKKYAEGDNEPDSQYEIVIKAEQMEADGTLTINLDPGIDVTSANELIMSVKSPEGGTFDIYGVWKYGNAIANTNGTQKYKIEPKTTDWTQINIPTSDIGYGMTDGNSGPITTVTQLVIKNSTASTFYVDNIYFSGTSPLAVEAVGAENDCVNVFNLQGICVKKGVNAEEATMGLPAGIYIVGGKKVLVTE